MSLILQIHKIWTFSDLGGKKYEVETDFYNVQISWKLCIFFSLTLFIQFDIFSTKQEASEHVYLQVSIQSAAVNL